MRLLVCRWVSQRKVFGKPLHSQAVIRSKLAAMISRVESAQNWLENITYQMNHMKYQDQAAYLAGYDHTWSTLHTTSYFNFACASPIALLKKYATETAQETARDAVQVSGMCILRDELSTFTRSLEAVELQDQVRQSFLLSVHFSNSLSGMGRFIEHVCFYSWSPFSFSVINAFCSTIARFPSTRKSLIGRSASMSTDLLFCSH